VFLIAPINKNLEVLKSGELVGETSLENLLRSYNDINIFPFLVRGNDS